MQIMNTAVPTLPSYRCHKIVRAAKIVDYSSHHDPKGTAVRLKLLVEGGPAVRFKGIDVYPDGCLFTTIEVDASFIVSRRVERGGYYVVYDDGYASYSPAKAFEEGYTLLLADADAPPRLGDPTAQG